MILGNIEAVRTGCTYVDKTLIDCGPKQQWGDTSKQYQTNLFVLGLICNNSDHLVADISGLNFYES